MAQFVGLQSQKFISGLRMHGKVYLKIWWHHHLKNCCVTNALDGIENHLIYEDNDCIDDCADTESELNIVCADDADEDILKSIFEASDEDGEYKVFWVHKLFLSILLYSKDFCVLWRHLCYLTECPRTTHVMTYQAEKESIWRNRH